MKPIMNKTEDENQSPAFVSSEAIEYSNKAALRRKLLISGISKGSVVAAATIPIKSLATQRYVTTNGKICTVSGTQSAAHSQTAGFQECVGGHPSYYCDTKKWPSPSNCKVGNITFTPKSPCKVLCGGSSNTTLIDCLKNTPNHDNSVIITAILNACKAKESPIVKSAYSPEELKSRFGDTRRQATLDFCRGYMQTKRS
jgi:hypothetical protein